jgi:hypothetical protein
MEEFDACIDLTVHNVSTGDPQSAVARVRSEVEALPGASWISVEWYGAPPPGLSWLRLFRRGDGRERADEAGFAEMRERIAAIVGGS